ncbi:MAG TPA: cellulose biosynthesis cyclic di-GMP-binding regulatory protein BcsB, partial [Candidatus Limiplasma sp.]|nr:cellulose biosynthesis cyclic di-GMP-binding regulatory protein BcsB [Candidatus Limiplasma sp.]
MGHRRILNPKILALALGSLLTAFALWAYAEGTVAAGDTASLTQLASVTVSNAAVTATPMPVPATATVYPAAIATGAVSPVMATAEPLATSSSIQTAAPVQMAVTASAAPALRVAQLALFQDTQSLTNPRNTVNVSFLLLNNTVLAGDATLSLHLEASDTLIDARSTVTIALNGENIATGRILDVVQNRGGIWQTTVPSRLIRTDGTGNALTVLTMQRSIEGECADIDNPSNWVKLLADSTLKFPIAQEGSFQLANLYEALFERVEAGDTLTTDLILDDPARIATVASMLRFCSAAGAYKPQKGALRLSVKPFGGDIGDANNQIRFGLFAVQRSADEQYRQIAPQTGYLMLEQSEDRLEMTIGGADDTGLRKAIDFAVRKDYLAGAEGTEVTVETDPGAPTVTLPDSRTGMYSFADFGYPTTMLKGAFHQQAVFSLSQPNGMKGGARSYLQLHYRHSQTLISDQSLMTVYINGDPVGSVKLSASNANDGSYKIALPEDALNAPTLTLRVEVYHYLGTVDCSKDYSDTAWTSIEADSAVYLEPSDTLVRPTLAGFPNIPATDSAAGAYMVLPDNASEGAL